jgi:hypothetical protein
VCVVFGRKVALIYGAGRHVARAGDRGRCRFVAANFGEER